MLPPVILPDADTEAALIAADVIKLPPVMLALALTEAALTAADVIRLPPMILPTTDSSPLFMILPAVMLPATLNAVAPVLAMATLVAVLNVTNPAAVVALIGPILMVVVDPARPPCPMFTVLVLAALVAALAMFTVCVRVL